MRKIGRKRVVRFVVAFEAANEFLRDRPEWAMGYVAARALNIEPPKEPRWMNGAEVGPRDVLTSEPPDAWMRNVTEIQARGRVTQVFVGRR